MLNIDANADPFVEILRPAYRRGLAQRQEAEKNKTALSGNFDEVQKRRRSRTTMMQAEKVSGNAHLDKLETALVECLRVFARRGRALREARDNALHGQQEQNKIACPENLGEDTGQARGQRETPDGVNDAIKL
jgi:hypothetical protein